jgi:methyl coenzyme M reductase gamma subunit
VQEEQLEEERLVAEKNNEAHVKALSEAGVLPLHQLFDVVVKKDKDLQRLQILPGFMSIFDQYRQIFEQRTLELVHDCVAMHQVQLDEEKVFADALDRQITRSEKQLLKMKDDFGLTVRKAVLGRSLDVLSDTRKEVLLLNDAMMEIETNTVHTISTMLDEYNEVYVRLSKDFDAKYDYAAI